MVALKIPPTQPILIVEDDADLSANLATAFSLKNIPTVQAKNGTECFNLIGQFHPRLIILDIMLPKMNGLDILKILKEQPETKDIPVIMASVLAAQDEKEKAISLGASDYLAKDELTPEEVVAKVKLFLSI